MDVQKLEQDARNTAKNKHINRANERLVWLVTGCSSGFGEAIIKTALKRGEKAIATARNIESISHLKALGAATLQLDITESPDSLDKKVEAAWNIYGHVDVLVQNAGCPFFGALEDLTPAQIQLPYDTNVFGVINLTRSITPYFRQRQSGYVVLVSSLGSTMSIPMGGAYTSSKAAIEAMMAAYGAEVASAGIQTLTLCPGNFRTDIRNPEKAKTRTVPTSKHHQDKLEMYHNNARNTHGKQSGSPEKFAALVVDLVKGTGVAQGREVPKSVPVGADAVPYEIRRMEKRLAELKEWQEVLAETDYNDSDGRAD